MSVEPAPRLEPSAAVTALHGVGPALAGKLAEGAGIATLGELLLFFPRRHDEVVDLVAPDDAHVGLLVRLRARVVTAHGRWLPGRRHLTVVELHSVAGEGGEPVDAGAFAVQFFNQPWLRNRWTAGTERQFEGTLDRARGKFVLKNARVVAAAMAADGPVIVRYPSVDGVSDQRLRALVDQALRRVDVGDGLTPPLPASLDHDAPLASAEALRAMHQPASVAEHEAARQHFALCEAVALFERVEAARRRREAGRAPDVTAADAVVDTLVAEIVPFAWTADQQRAVARLAARLVKPAPMGALLQGDVGTGKTAVALAAALRVIASGYQVAVLAPTELLAEQLHAVYSSWLAGRDDIVTACLVGSLGAAARRRVDDLVATGAAQLVCGTHALLSDTTRFAKLGLVVVDEQHRFGVDQRTRLVAKGASPHVLVMTATPIPRTLTLTLFGDLDVDVLRERPPGRRPVPAVFVARDDWPRVRRAIDRHVRRGGGVYVVCSKIGEDGERGGAVRMHAELSTAFRCGLAHGRLAPRERQRATDAFRAGDVDVLVGTTVLEVGVDVDRATLIVVVNADRFGLATLHQLRGRVGRGGRRGLCVLTGERSARVAAVCSTTDGFELAEQDLALRGAGELLGTRQVGAIDFRALDVLADRDLLLRAREAVRRDPA